MALQPGPETAPAASRAWRQAASKPRQPIVARGLVTPWAAWPIWCSVSVVMASPCHSACTPTGSPTPQATIASVLRAAGSHRLGWHGWPGDAGRRSLPYMARSPAVDSVWIRCGVRAAALSPWSARAAEESLGPGLKAPERPQGRAAPSPPPRGGSRCPARPLHLESPPMRVRCGNTCTAPATRRGTRVPGAASLSVLAGVLNRPESPRRHAPPRRVHLYDGQARDAGDAR